MRLSRKAVGFPNFEANDRADTGFLMMMLLRQWHNHHELLCIMVQNRGLVIHDENKPSFYFGTAPATTINLGASLPITEQRLLFIEFGEGITDFLCDEISELLFVVQTIR